MAIAEAITDFKLKGGNILSVPPNSSMTGKTKEGYEILFYHNGTGKITSWYFNY